MYRQRSLGCGSRALTAAPEGLALAGAAATGASEGSTSVSAQAWVMALVRLWACVQASGLAEQASTETALRERLWPPRSEMGSSERPERPSAASLPRQAVS